ncbi:MAG: hypothetical protein HY961_03590 [Ignavibacteriae bacterium]|nr:hypothetical protein [Ignavibacteriota bacterium]
MTRRREHMLFAMEIKQCFSVKRLPVFILLILIAVRLIVQESEIPTMLIVLFAVFAILESQFTNILFRTPHELEALSMFPLSWKKIVLVKNLATLTLFVIVALIVSMATIYFTPKHIGWQTFRDSIVFASSIIFLLLHIGNRESVSAPRRSSGWSVSDLVQAVGMFLFVTALSFPYILFSVLLDQEWLTIVYAAGTAWYWLKRSVPRTAINIELLKTSICTNR